MSGHSKWANIRVRKTAEDAKRGKVFTRHARLVEMAVRAGGPDMGTNSTLRTAVDNAKADNVPNANIERAIKKGSGELKGESMAEIVYAAYGPGGAAFLIECITDNRNRTVANVKSTVSAHGGHMAESNSVLWMFQRKGVVSAKGQGPGTKTIEEIELELIDFGAEDVSAAGDVIDVTTDGANWVKIRDFFKQNGYEILAAGSKYVPTQKADIKDAATAEKVAAFIEVIEEDDDVSEVHTNAEVGEGLIT